MTGLLRTILLAALLGASVPATAQTFHFGFGLGIDQGDDPDTEFLPRRLCVLTDRGLRNEIEAQGYDHIFLNVPTGYYVQARATRGDWVYLLKVNVCTGVIVDRDRLRRSAG
mgnify:CR=1 FL=1